MVMPREDATLKFWTSVGQPIEGMSLSYHSSAVRLDSLSVIRRYCLKTKNPARLSRDPAACLCTFTLVGFNFSLRPKELHLTALR